MRRRLLKAIFFLLLACGLVALLWRGDGYLLIAYGTKTIEMTLWVAALVFVLLYAALWFLRKLMLGSVGMVRRFREIFLFGSVERAALYLFCFGMWAAMLLWSKPWLDRFQYGPLEWLWRSLSRWQVQPMRKAPVAQ